MDTLLIALVLQYLFQTLRVMLAKQLVKLLIQVYNALLWWLNTNLLLHALKTQEILEAKVVDLIGFTATFFKFFDLLSFNLTKSTTIVVAAFFVAVTRLFLLLLGGSGYGSVQWLLLIFDGPVKDKAGPALLLWSRCAYLSFIAILQSWRLVRAYTGAKANHVSEALFD